MVAAGEMLEHAEVFGNLYGSPRAPVEAAMAAGRDTLFDIDWQGGQQIRNSAWQGRGVDLHPAALDRRTARRLRSAGRTATRSSPAAWPKARDEISHWAEYDYVLVNHDLDATAAHAAPSSPPNGCAATASRADGFVRALNREFEERT
jgi:guanylate kinase